MKTPQQALAISVTAASVIVVLKWSAWWMTGSVGFLSDAIHSVVNIVAASFALAMVTFARRAPTAAYPYGYGKGGYFSAVVEGSLIMIAAFAILLAANDRVLHPHDLQPVGAASGLSATAALINLAVAQLLIRVGRENHSLATEADGKHLLSDVWITVGVIAGVLLAALTRRSWLDAATAAAVALNLLRTGVLVVWRAIRGLMDAAWPAGDIATFERELRSVEAEHARFADLRTRVSGARRFAAVKLVVPQGCSIARANAIAASAEQVAARQGVTLLVRIVPSET